MCEHAETYRVQALAAACARVIVLVGADDADWGVIDKAPIVTAALARLAVPKKGRKDRPAATQTEDEARAELFPQADHQVHSSQPSRLYRVTQDTGHLETGLKSQALRLLESFQDSRSCV